ncbi:unnamed protein product [Calicophoron daubneyi]|uniref:FMRFamide-activated amiloride-sensitive sodium channel n=1 Tax=Calicophoron daubneyi TaxID=300641 RepID=A0AAV2T7I0_CALDB
MTRRRKLSQETKKDVLRSFCSWTSVRGLQHVIRSEHPLLRTIWAVFVTVMFILNVTVIILLFAHYLQYNTVENIKIKRGVSVEFPDVTLCNVDPVDSDRIYCLKNPDEPGCNISNEYRWILDKYMQAVNYSKFYKDTKFWDKIVDLNPVAIFYQLIGMKAASQVGHQLEDIIIPTFCEVTTQEKGGILQKLKCDKRGIIFKNIINYKYFNCFTVTIADKFTSTKAVRLSVVLYLDEEEDLSCRPHCTHEFTEWAGGKVVVHERGTYPDIDQMGMNLLPGASNQILIDEVRRIEKKRLESKPCETDENKTLMVLHLDMNSQTFEPRKMHYTQSLCIQLSSQKATIESCHCIDVLFPLPTDLKQSLDSLPFCGNISRPDVYNSLSCIQDVRMNQFLKFGAQCMTPCVEKQYGYELTQLRWPQKPRILKYFENLKDRIYYKRKFKIYEEIERISHSNTSLALKMLLSTDIFEKNFLQLDVNRPSFDTLVSYTENEVYNLPTLLSQVGGLCSVFLSFTCVSILELIELAFRLIWVTWPRLIPSLGWQTLSVSVADGRCSSSKNPQVTDDKERKVPRQMYKNNRRLRKSLIKVQSNVLVQNSCNRSAEQPWTWHTNDEAVRKYLFKENCSRQTTPRLYRPALIVSDSASYTIVGRVTDRQVNQANDDCTDEDGFPAIVQINHSGELAVDTPG